MFNIWNKKGNTRGFWFCSVRLIVESRPICSCGWGGHCRRTNLCLLLTCCRGHKKESSMQTNIFIFKSHILSSYCYFDYRMTERFLPSFGLGHPQRERWRDGTWPQRELSSAPWSSKIKFLLIKQLDYYYYCCYLLNNCAIMNKMVWPSLKARTSIKTPPWPSTLAVDVRGCRRCIPVSTRRHKLSKGLRLGVGGRSVVGGGVETPLTTHFCTKELEQNI